MEPSSFTRRLRRLADRIDGSDSPSASRVSSTLRRMVSAMEGGKPVEKVVLQGPWHEATMQERQSANVDEEVEGVLIENDAFNQAAHDTVDPEDLASGWHSLELYVEYDWERGDGGNKEFAFVHKWEIVTLDGMILDNPADKAAVEAALTDVLEPKMEGWAADHTQSEGDQGPPSGTDEYRERQWYGD